MNQMRKRYYIPSWDRLPPGVALMHYIRDKIGIPLSRVRYAIHPGQRGYYIEVLS
jgi:hypothetical protein